MLIKELAATWPPAVTTGTEEGLKLDDLVVSAQASPDAKGYIIIALRRPTGAEYGTMLVLPENLLDKVLGKILEKKGLTLRELGNVEVTDTWKISFGITPGSARQKPRNGVNGYTMPLLEIYKDNEIHSSAVQSADSGLWTPDVTATKMTVKMRLTVPNTNKTFPTREEAEQAGLLFAKKWIDDGQPL